MMVGVRGKSCSQNVLSYSSYSPSLSIPSLE